MTLRIDPATSPVQAALLDRYLCALEEESQALHELLRVLMEVEQAFLRKKLVRKIDLVARARNQRVREIALIVNEMQALQAQQD